MAPLTRYDQLEEREGRWWYNDGEITAPFYAEDLGGTVYPPWWPIYFDRTLQTTVNLDPGRRR